MHRFVPCLAVAVLGCRPPAPSATRGPIIDVHMHGTVFPPNADTTWFPTWLKPAPSNDALRRMTLDSMRYYNIVKGIVSENTSMMPMIRQYRAEDSTRIIIGFLWGDNPDPIDSLPGWLADHTVQVLGEITTQYGGLAPNDPALEPIWKLAEQFDVPVGIHVGLGPPGAAWTDSPRYRMSLSNALLLEDVLIRHPRLRLYVMHAGWPRTDEMVGLLYQFPNVYVDIGVIDWYIARAEFYAHLKRLVDAGFGKRIMFGSDQMQWPGAIGAAITAVDSAPFLSAGQRRDIYCNNAARFLRLDPQLCAR